MIGVNRIHDILELVVWSGYIKDEPPVSALVTAPVEAGKTDLVLKFSQNVGCVVLTDATAYGIMRDYGNAIKSGEIRHLIIPDMVKPMSRGKNTVNTLIAFLNSLVEEGVIGVSTYAEKIVEQVPVKCGLIATLAKDVLEDGRHQWNRMGFMSRMIPLSYTYGARTKAEIYKSIANREYLKEEPVKLDLPPDEVEIKLSSPESDELMALTTALTTVLTSSRGKKKPEEVYGFRLQKHLQRLAMASALKDGRVVVEQKDVDLIKELSSCINLEYYPI